MKDADAQNADRIINLFIYFDPVIFFSDSYDSVRMYDSRYTILRS